MRPGFLSPIVQVDGNEETDENEEPLFSSKSEYGVEEILYTFKELFELTEVKMVTNYRIVSRVIIS